MKISVQTVSAFKVFEHAQFCFKLLASSILSKPASSVAAQLLHADRTEHALPPCYGDREQLLYKPASYRAAPCPQRRARSAAPAAPCPQRRARGHFSGSRRPPRAAAAAGSGSAEVPPLPAPHSSSRFLERRCGKAVCRGRARTQPSDHTVGLQVTTLLASTAQISLWRVKLFFPYAF